MKYCRQRNESQLLQRSFNQSCHHGGQLWSFKDLAIRNVSVLEVLDWSSSMEQTDRYSKYLSNDLFDTADDNYICNCTNRASFGKFCEYEFYYGELSFTEALLMQLSPIRNLDIDEDKINVGSQFHNNQPCYMTLECNSGLMCLDWRYICDGKQQCMDGVDEDHCELLEFNECEDNEYRCANGMCIPEEYWLDGDYDCMDWTDETGTLTNSGSLCPLTSFRVCDEHWCPYNQWSCGDGQCVDDESDRHEGIRFGYTSFCYNLRDIQYMCESATRNLQSWWTIDGGYCLPYRLHYQTLNLDTTAKKDRCDFVVKCALSDSLDQDCTCKNKVTCRHAVNSSCSSSFLVYPGFGPILSPGFHMIYEIDRDWTNKKPDFVQVKGQIKCIGYHVISNGIWARYVTDELLFYSYFQSEDYFCNIKQGTYAYHNSSGPQYAINCWNNSKTFNNQSYQVSFRCGTRCISKYRIRDGIRDCSYFEEAPYINNSCPQIQRHRLQCSLSELTCLLVGTLGSQSNQCFSERDEFDFQTGIALTNHIDCSERMDPGCIYLQNYIRISSYNETSREIINDNSALDMDQSIRSISFRTYCNSFFDTKSGFDELPEFCQKWVCSIDEYQCLSGQCISPGWICDGEWDCNDGSDEQRLFVMDHLSAHNSRLLNLFNIKNQCYQRYRYNTPFADICNILHEYPCFRNDVDQPLNLTMNRPCIRLTQIGDGKIDCLSGLDERNRLQCAKTYMLGYHYQFSTSDCIHYTSLCTDYYSWISDTDMTYASVCFYRRTLFRNDTNNNNCNGVKDVICLNNTCKKNARCNGKMECPHGEDEYRCIPQGNSQLIYRAEKQIKIQFVEVRLAYYPLPTSSLSQTNSLLPSIDDIYDNYLYNITNEMNHLTIVYEKQNPTIDKSVYEIIRDALPNGTITFKEHYLPFICNRGLAVKYYTGHTVCFCPPSFHGSQCEIHSDRITILTHMNLTNYHPTSNQITVIKVLVTFLFKNQTLDYAEFHVNPRLENGLNYIKQHLYFLYPRTQEFLQMKKTYRNGTQLYSVRFEAFDLHVDDIIKPIGVWHYPIYFDFLPSFRLSKILHFPSPNSIPLSNNPCVNHPCGKNGICHIINSNRSAYFCSCHNGYYGIHCESYDEECKNYCSPKSLCKPKHRRMLTGNQHSLCICPVSTFGSTCSIKNDQCRQNPCMNGGTCFGVYYSVDTNYYICSCTDAYEGDHCEYARGTVDMTIFLPSNAILQISNIVLTTVLYTDFENPSLRLNYRYQQVYLSLPSHLILNFSRKSVSTVPIMAIMKVYEVNYRNREPKYFLLYYQPNQKSINITTNLTSENHCPLVHTLWYLISDIKITNYFNNSTFNSTIAVFFYHHLCRAKQTTNVTFTCFRDFNYICMCEEDDYRAECFRYDQSIDRCALCLVNGYCLKGDINDPNDFVCLCPRCYYGQVCQYSTELMSFTLDSLIVKDIQNSYRLSSAIYILVAILIFLCGLFNNLCSFLTFIRPKPRKIGVGNYLFIISIIDQCSLLFLLLKIIHINLGSNGTLFDYAGFNLYSCKIISYLLSVFTRLTYWLTSLVTIERLRIVLFPTSATLKNPRLAFLLTIFAILMVSSMHIHEILYHTTIKDPSYTSINITLCVTNYAQSLVLIYNRLNILIHYFIPFLIQMISITIMIIQTATSRARTSNNRQETFVSLLKKQLKTQKELYITPMIIIGCSLPQIILSFSYACRQLNESWQRYSLLVGYFFSYLPQILGFILYVLPSTSFSEEFHQTMIGKRIRQQQKQHR